jgi:hypothetical protein
MSSRHSPRPVKVYYPGGTFGHCKSVRSALAAVTKHMLADPDMLRVNITYEDVPVADVEWDRKTSIVLQWKKYALKIGV